MSDDKQTESVIKKLQIKAKKGGFYSAYQLYEYYYNGTYVKKSPAKSKQFLLRAFDLFKTQKLRVTRLAIENFRAVHDLDLPIPDPNLTVILGVNGAGKTSILDAIAINMSWLHNRIVKSGGSGELISPLDITLGNQSSYSSILTRFSLNKKLFADMELISVNEGHDIKKKSYLRDITKLGSMYKKANSIDSNFNMPLLAYYTVSRSLDVNVKDMASFDETAQISENDKFVGYHNSLNGKADFKLFFRWFKRLDDIEKHRESASSKNSYEKLLALLPEDMDETTKKVLFEALSSNDSALKDTDTESFDDVNKFKASLNKLVGFFMEGYGNIEIQIEPYLTITIEKNGQKLNVLQLSQGEKSLLALVLDIGRRLIILNPALENPLDGEGIVLIDEIDLHLHPAWQRKIIKRLPEAFKNCQFIVTTHSAQVVGEVKHSQIVILEQQPDNSVEYSQPNQSYGLTSNDILNEIMSTEHSNINLNRNSYVEEQLAMINELIAEGSCTKAKNIISDLESELNGEIPELLSAKLDIELADWDD